MVNNELEGCGRQQLSPDVKVLSWNLPGVTEENLETYGSS
jgi:hypothetical protein